MTKVFTIQLENLEFFAYHGLYEIEKKEGNIFLVNISVSYTSLPFQNSLKITDILDYAMVFRVVNSWMATPTELLENLCINITDEIYLLSNQIKAVKLSISKLNPPLGGKCEKSTVVYEMIK